MSANALGIEGVLILHSEFRTRALLKIIGPFLLCCAWSCNVIAADLSAHARTEGWKRLLHYEYDPFSATGLKSAIHSRDFFLSDSGRIDPEAELKATLAEMLEPATAEHDMHAKCRFPARLMWLQKNFPEFQASLAPIQCPDFAAWVSIGDIDSVSLVFANGYLGNPASYYGHLFLKINNRKDKAKSHLIDLTLNFGAIDTGKDDPLSYIVKGIAGGYDGGFSPIEFYFHNANYGENELRDLWEYRLNLRSSDVHYIVAHAWEILQKKYTYYFFHDNCAFRVAELLEIVEGVEANPRNRPWIFPQAVLQKLSSSVYRGEALVGSKIFHPSRQTRLYDRYVSLNAGQRNVVSGIIAKNLRFDGPEMQRLPLAEQQAVIDALLDYHQFRNLTSKQNGVQKMPPEYVEALSARLRLPPGETVPEAQEVSSPDTGNAPSWVQIGFAHRQDGRNTQTLRIRPAYYDSLDVRGAQAKNSGLSMGDLLLELDDQRMRMVHFDIIAIDSTNPAVTGLPGDRGVGWKLRAGLEQERLRCLNCLAVRVQGDYSLGSLIGSPKVFGAIHAGGTLQGHADFDGIGFARLGASVLVRPSAEFGVRLSHEVRRPFESGFAPYTLTSAEARFALAEDYDFRLKWERDTQYKAMIGIGRYW